MHRPETIVRTAVILGACAALLGCGPSLGADCTGRQFSCGTEASALECRDGTWTELPCRGEAGCQVVEGRVRCDMTLNQPGDLCPVAAEGQATCKTPELNAVLECRSGVLVQTRTCSDCFGSETITCVP